MNASLTREGQYNDKSCKNHCAFWRLSQVFQGLKQTCHTDPLFFELLHITVVEVMMHPVDPTVRIQTLCRLESSS